MKAVIKFLGRSAVGLGVLKLLSLLGLGIGVNLANAVVMGLLGVPGFALLLMGNVLL